MLTKSQNLLYILIKKSGGVEDKTKLAKLQYFADFINYAFNNRTISQDSIIYTRQKQGLLARGFSDDLENLKNEGLITETPKYHYKVKKDILIKLTPEEEKTINFVLNKYSNSSYKELVDICHAQSPYLSSNDNEIVEFFTAYNLVDDYPDYATSNKRST